MSKREHRNHKTGFAWKMPTVAAAFTMALAMVLAGCPTGTERFTVTFDRNFAANQGTGTAPVPQRAEAGTSITLPGQGNLNRPSLAFDGWNTQADGQGENYAAGSAFTVEDDITLFARWREPEAITVNITELPAGTGWASISLRNLAGDEIAEGQTSVGGTTATIQFTIIPGTYNIWLELQGQMGTTLHRTTSPVQINSGNNNIAFDRFEEILPITITITGITGADTANQVDIELREIGETGKRVAQGWGSIQEGSVTNIIMRGEEDNARFVTPGTYEVRLTLIEQEDWNTIGIFRIASRNITAGNNPIAFNEFQEIPPITVTVTNIPTDFHDYLGGILAFRPGDVSNEGIVGESDLGPLEATTTFILHGATPGTYDIALVLMDGETFAFVGIRIATSRNLAATEPNNTPWSDFANIPLSTLTVTWIPDDYRGLSAMAMVMNIATQELIAGSPGGTMVMADGSLTTILFDFEAEWVLERAVSGNVVLLFEDEVEHPDGYWEWDIIGVYATLTSITFPAGENTAVQWGQFIDVGAMFGLSADMEPTGRSPQGRPGTRSHLLRAR